MNNLLSVQNLDLGFRDGTSVRKILHSVSFDLKKSETLAIVGESGSGKSVTALAIMRLLSSPPAIYLGGKIEFHTQQTTLDLLRISEDDIRKLRGKNISMIFQEPMTSLNPVFTCGDQVAEAIRIHQQVSAREARSLTLDWFKEVQLPRPEKLLDAYPHEISGGQKQRVMIAMAMCNHPDILIADEPTTALDVTVQKAILELMADLKSRYNTSMIFISHDLGVVREVADSVLVMYQGEIVENGSSDAVFHTPKHPYTRGLISCRPDPRRYLHRIPTISDFMQNTFVEGEGRFILGSKTERIQTAKQKVLLPPVLEVKNLTVSYEGRTSWFGKNEPGFKAVDQVSFDVYPGEILGLVGESGCGKTTLSRALLNLIPISSGSVKYKERELAGLPESQMRKIRPSMQMVFQDPYSALNPRLTVGRAVQEPIQVHFPELSAAEIRQRAEELFIQTGLDPALHYNRFPHEFSGGQRQRICIARALATRPDFLICDESVSALDVSVQAQILNLLNDLRESMGFACIFISHDLQVVRYMSDRILVMQQGKIVESGFTEMVCDEPQHAYTQSLLEANALHQIV